MHSSRNSDLIRVRSPKDVAAVAQRLGVPFKHVGPFDIFGEPKRRYKSMKEVANDFAPALKRLLCKSNILLLFTGKEVLLIKPESKDVDAVVKYNACLLQLRWGDYSIASLTNSMNPNEPKSEQECCVCLNYPRFGLVMRCKDCCSLQCIFCIFKIMTHSGKCMFFDRVCPQRKCPQCSRVDKFPWWTIYPLLMEEMNTMNDEQKKILQKVKAQDEKSKLRFQTWNNVKKVKKGKIVRIFGLSKAKAFNGKFASVTEHPTKRKGVLRWPVRLFDPSKDEFTDTTTLCLKSENLEVDCCNDLHKFLSI